MTYLDHAATTPLDPRVLDAMMPFLTTAFGNASSLHTLGQEAKFALDDARDRVAAFLGAQAREIVFTSGGTEADNLAVRGVLWERRSAGKHLIVSAIEHEAVLNTAGAMEQLGWDVTRLPVDRFGTVLPVTLREAIRPDTVLASIMAANNEVGTIQDIPTLAGICREAGVLFHTDAVQAAGAMDLDVRALGADLLSISGHKIGGPKGIGALWVRHGVRISPQSTGGGQERDRRSGTENVASIVGLGRACDLAAQALASGEVQRVAALRDRLIEGLLANAPGAVLTGHPANRLPGSASFLFPGLEGEAILLNLDFEGIEASSGSACSAGAIEPSHVLLAMGYSAEEARGALRMSLGRSNTNADIDRVLDVLPRVIRQLASLATGQPG